MEIVLLGQDRHAGDKAGPQPGRWAWSPHATGIRPKAPQSLSVLLLQTLASTGGQSWRAMSEAAVQLLRGKVLVGSLYPALSPAAGQGSSQCSKTAQGGQQAGGWGEDRHPDSDWGVQAELRSQVAMLLLPHPVRSAGTSPLPLPCCL